MTPKCKLLLWAFIALAGMASLNTRSRSWGETITPVAITKRGQFPKRNPTTFEGHFATAPVPGQVDEIDPTNQNVTGREAGPCTVNGDGALLDFIQRTPQAKVSVFQRGGHGSAYYVSVWPSATGAGGGGLGRNSLLWANVKDYSENGLLVLDDKNGGQSVSDSTNPDGDAPTLDCHASGNPAIGSALIWFQGGSGSYNWHVENNGVSAPNGMLNEADNYSASIPNLAPGTYSLTLDSPTDGTFHRKINFNVVAIWIDSVSITTDPGLLTDKNDDFGDGGEKYSKPDWTYDGSKHNSVSHTWDQKMSADLEIVVVPGGAPAQSYDIAGTGCGDFLANGVSVAGGRHKVHVTATNALPKKINKITTGINWTLSQGGTALIVQQAGPATIYVVAGPSIDAGAGLVTLKRMEWAVGAALGQTAPDDIASKIADKANTSMHFGNNQSPPDGWERLNPPGANVDCLQAAEVACYAVRLLGIDSSDAEACATSDSNAEDQETKVSTIGHGRLFLRYETSDGDYLNNYEGYFSYATNGTAHNLQTVYGRYGVIVGPNEPLRLLNAMKTNEPAFKQWWSYDQVSGTLGGPPTRVKEPGLAEVPLPANDH